MRRKLFLWIATLFTAAQAVAQTAKVPTLDPNPDYASFGYYNTEQDRRLNNIKSGEDYTALQIKITVKSNREGMVVFPRGIYISGGWGSLLVRRLTIGNDIWELDRPYTYPRNSRGSNIVCTLFFDRIPAGIASVDYCEPHVIRWDNIPIADNPNTGHTAWTQALLKERWKESGCSTIEGIYTYVSTNNKKWWGNNRHTLAILKTDDGYDLLYLKGSYPGVWKEGDIKARFVPTAESGVYKATAWYTENKKVNEDFYIMFKNQRLHVYEADKENLAQFLKIYPASETPRLQNRKTGSGVIIGRQGIVATNYHVIEGAEAIDVSIKNDNGTKTCKAEVLCTDKANDLALLRLEAFDAETFPAVPYAIPSKTFDVGTSVFTMGYPMADFMGNEVKITDGIINAKTGYQGDVATYQISAPIQQGNSGGPLFDKKGNLVGITNAGILAANNVGYAIKAVYLRNLIESAPVHIEIPETSELAGMELPEQIKRLSDLVVYIKVR